MCVIGYLTGIYDWFSENKKSGILPDFLFLISGFVIVLSYDLSARTILAECIPSAVSVLSFQ